MVTAKCPFFRACIYNQGQVSTLQSDVYSDSHSTCAHFVQLHGPKTASLARNAVRFFRAGVLRGDSILIIAGPENTAEFLEEFKRTEMDPDDLIGSGRLTTLNASHELMRFMSGRFTDRPLFRRTIGDKVQQLRARASSGEITAYGEMVGELWTSGCFTAAMEVEELWNELLSSTASRLLCGYPIDIFGPAFHSCDVEALLASHDHMVPVEAGTDLEAAIYQAMDDVLGPLAASVRLRIAREPQPAWALKLRAEALILWVRANLSVSAEPILDKARQYYTLSTHNGSGEPPALFV